MAAITTLPVDGQHGIDIAGNLRTPEVTSLVTRADATLLNGANGANAGIAIEGSPGGFLAVQLSPSSTSSEGFLIETLAQIPSNQLPRWTEIAAQRDVLLSAVGGNGETGRQGGDGENGRAGIEGSPATRLVDAGPGGDGENGGNAGLGSHGANGGKGGSVNIFVNEDMTHLLLAVKWEIRGGLGGAPGQDGQPGRGGIGGRGGATFEWTQHIGYDLHCNTNCVGVSKASVARRALANRPASASMAMSALPLVKRISPQIVQGTNIQTIIAQTAIKYRNFSDTDRIPNNDACRCKGGSDGCVGCEKRAVQQIYQRPLGPEGHDGVAGIAAHSLLQPGVQGEYGLASIVVRCVDGREEKYGSCYGFQLIDFDVEDENEDGIFEPGEHIYICRVRIKNIGGMPTPNCQIPITVLPSAAIIPLVGEGSQTFIPRSVQAGGIATADGSIKAKLRHPQAYPNGEPYIRRCNISLRATMPYLNRRLDGFEATKSITIQYPVDLRNLKMLPNVAQGSRTEFRCEIYNKGAKGLGFETVSFRRVNIHISVPEESGRLLGRTAGLEDTHGLRASTLEPKTGLPITQTMQISPSARDYSSVVLRVRLSISTPESYPQCDRFRSIQCCQLAARVSSGYQYNENSTFLVVTNQTTTREHLMAVQHHVQDQLDLHMDILNVALYGGLRFSNAGDDEDLFDVVSNYRNGITIIFLGGSFDFFGLGARSILHLSDLSLVGRAHQSGVSCLFLGLLNDVDAKSSAQSMLYPLEFGLQETLSRMTKTSLFTDEQQLLWSLTQMKAHDAHVNPVMATYHIPVFKKWYRSTDGSLKQRADQVTSYLRDRLPQERFWICPHELEATERQDQTHVGSLAIAHGVPFTAQLALTERRKVRGLGGASTSRINVAESTPKLDLYDQYAIICALNVPTRINLIFHPPNTSSTAQPSESVFLATAITLSLAERFDAQIHAFLHHAKSSTKIHIPTNHIESDKILAVHLPAVAVFFSHLQSTFPEDRVIPENIFLILRYLLASSSANGRHLTASGILSSLQTRRSSLFTLLEAKVKALLPEKGHSATQTNTFFVEWKAWRAQELANARNTTKAIVRSLALLLKTSEHIYEEGKLEASDVDFERTKVCTSDEWNARATLIRERRIKVDEDGTEARTKLEEMNGVERVDDDRASFEMPAPPAVEIATGSKRGRMKKTTSV